MADKPIDKLRLGASSRAVALADVSVADLMASMSDEQKTELAAALAPPKAEDEPKGETEPTGKAEQEPGDKGDDKGKEEAEPGADAADPNHVQYGHGFAAACERTRTVAASKEFAGRESAAVKLLGNAKLSADEIVSTLADLPKGGSDMLAGLKGGNPDLGAGAEAKGSDSKADASESWSRTFERLGWAGDDKNRAR